MKNYFIKSKYLYVVILLCGLIYSCTEVAGTKTKQKIFSNEKEINQLNPVKKKTFQLYCLKINYNKNNTFNSTVSLLTGEGRSNYKTTIDSFYWNLYQEFIEMSWKKLEQQRLNKIKKWREREISRLDTISRTVFYPFSGPDFLTAAILFPQVDTFILLGLEPIGSLPDFSNMSSQKQQEYLSSFSNSLGDIFHKSYFITRKMLHDFQSNKVNGLLPALTFFIKKLNYNIADIQYIYKDSTQKITELNYFSKNKQKPFGVKITAIKDSCTTTIYYFRYNVMDKFFNDSNTFYQYLSKYHHYITYIKSASYLLHNSFMTNMRNLILTNSIAILQDDTGMPYQFLKDSDQWHLKLYGNYDKPVKDFGKMGYQPELAKKMKQDSAFIPKLPFHLGYHWGNKKDVLMFAIKK